MANDGQARPGSSWQRWTSGAARPSTPAAPPPAADPLGAHPDEPAEERAAPRSPFEPATPSHAPDGDSDLDVLLEWPEVPDPLADDDRLPPPAATVVDEEVADGEFEPDVERDGSLDEPDDLWPADDADDDEGTATAGWGDLDEDDDDERADAGTGEPLLPAMASRIDTVQGGITSLMLRIESLIGATGTMRSTIADRVEDYSATVSRLALNSAHDLDEYRRTTERSMAELRRASLATDQALSRLAARTEEVGTDVGSLTDLVRSLVDDVRIAAQGARATPASAAAVPAPLAEAGAEPGPTPVSQDDLLDISDAVDALRGELALLRTRLETEARVAAPAPAPEAAGADAEALLDEVRALRADVADLREAIGAAAAGGGAPEGLGEIRELLAFLVDTMPDSQEGSGATNELLRSLAARLDKLPDTFVERLATRFEVVEDAPPRRSRPVRSEP